MKRTTHAWVALTATVALLAGCGGGNGIEATDSPTAPEDGGGQTTEASGTGETEFDEATQSLIDEALAAGPVTMYSMIDETALRTITQAFTEKYGVDVSPLRLVSGDLTQRYSAEAGSGEASADVILLTHSPFFAEALDQGWLASVSDLDLPEAANELPAEFIENDGAVPIVSFIPTESVINTDNVPNPPAVWTDYAEPEFRGRMMLAEPNSSPANASFWSLMREEFGDEFLEGIAANEPRWGAGAVPITQAVAAGEADLGHPGVAAIVNNLQGQGAPVELVALSPTTGPEAGVGISANSPNQAGAKLMALYLMSEEGNALLNDETAAISPFDTEGMDRFTRVKDIGEVDVDAINSLLGR